MPERSASTLLARHRGTVVRVGARHPVEPERAKATDDYNDR